MAEYVDKEKLIKRLHNAEENYKADHDYDIDNDPFSDGILSAMFSVNQIVGSEPTANVVEKEMILDFIEDNRPTDVQTDWERGCAYICDEIEKLLK